MFHKSSKYVRAVILLGNINVKENKETGVFFFEVKIALKERENYHGIIILEYCYNWADIDIKKHLFLANL